MPCPTCSATMHCLGTMKGRAHYHCPRCGTCRMKTGGHVHDTVPALVTRCRQFEADAPARFGEAWTGSHWHRLGILEAIHPPGERA